MRAKKKSPVFDLTSVLAWLFFSLLLLIQYPLWLGKGGWLQIWKLEHSLQQQSKKNTQLAQKNKILAAEVKNLNERIEAIEEQARFSFGLIRKGEHFVNVVNKKPKEL